MTNTISPRFGTGAMLLSLCAISSLPPASAVAQEKDQTEETARIGVGDKAPDFTLTDQEGKKRSLKGLLEAGPTALVFYRSADW